MNAFSASRARLRGYVISSALLLFASRSDALPAFPGAEGFGANATGGRGGSVYVVTNLNDSGAGSFRDAVSQPNRTVVFAVGGIIRINSPVVVRSNLTIAGQTAPGEGVTIYGNRVSFSDASNTIVRYLRFRQGINGDSGSDAVGIASGHDMIFDHVSASWGRDETFSISGSAISNITLQDCIIGQGLLLHSAGGLMQTDGGVSIFRCLYTDNWMRNPKVKGVNDYANNVVYNWGGGGGYIPAGDSAGLSYANVVGNYFIAGPNTVDGPFKTGNANFHLYAAGNLQDTDRDGALDGVSVPVSSFSTLTLVDTAYAYPPVATLLSPAQAYAHVVAHAGASLHRDPADLTMIDELTSLGTRGAHITTEAEVGGIGALAGGLAPADGDADGMPDWWEEAAGHDLLVADHNGDANGDGYTNLENYLNALAIAGVPAVTIDTIDSDTGAFADDGITADTTIALRGMALPGATITLARADLGAIGTTTADGAGQWSFALGAALAERYYAFTATAELPTGQASPSTRAFVVRVDTTPAEPPVVTSLVLTPSVSVNGSAKPGDAITVSLAGAGVVGTAVADGLGNWSAPYAGPPLGSGVHTFTASAVDLAGNAGSPSESYVVDTSLAAPVFAGVTSDTGASANDRITTDTTLVFAGTSGPDTAIAINRSGVGVVGTVAADGEGNWSFDYTATTLGVGAHTFSATAAVGENSSPASEPFVVTIDTVRPSVSSIRRLTPSTAATTANSLIYRVTFSESVGGVDAADFALTLSGVTAVIASVAPVNAATYDVSLNGVAGDGTVRLDLRSSGTGIVDIAGNPVSGGYTAGQLYTIRLPGSGVWTSFETGGVWSDAANWEAGTIAGGAGTTADFGTLDLDTDVTVVLDGPRTLGRLVFGDNDSSSPASWTLTNGGAPANTLALSAAAGAPTIEVTATGTGAEYDISLAASATPAAVDVRLTGTTGLTKSGLGTAMLTQANAISGPLTVAKGFLKVGAGGALAPATTAIAVSSQLHVQGGEFSTTGDVAITSGGNSGIVVSGGTAQFNAIVPSNARNPVVKITGGSLTASSLMFQRSADAANMYGVGLVVQGGEATIGTVGLGTNNSWGAMSVEGGSLTVTGPLWVGWQATAGRGGQVRVTGGVFRATDPVDGVVLSRRHAGGNANNVAHLNLLGGIGILEKLTLGYDETVNAGSATVTLDGGALYLGAGGLVKKGTGAFAATVNLVRGTLGARTDWTSAVPLNLPAGNGLVIAAEDPTGMPHDIALHGPLAGAGGFAKAGGGTLTLAGASTYTGATTVEAGTLRVDGQVAAAGGIAVRSGAVLTGQGGLGGPVALASGGTVAPDAATLTAGALDWAAGGRVRLELGSGRLVLDGALGGTGPAGGSREFVFRTPAPAPVDTVYPVVRYATSNLPLNMFTYTGLDGYLGAFEEASGELRFRITGAGASAHYTHWAYLAGLPGDRRAPEDDPDGDGAPNLLEFVLATDPLAGEAASIAALTVLVEGVEYPAIRFVRRQDIGGVTVAVQASASLEFGALLPTTEVSATPQGDGTDLVVVRSTTPLSNEARQFLRVIAHFPVN
ncbi:MAG TPA: Ig-like domain-containing protein [Opitutaceae bacterium]